MDAKHMHMEIVNRRKDNDEAYHRCVGVLDAYRALPGQQNDPGEKETYDMAVSLGDEIKDMIREHARDEYGMSLDGGRDLTATLYSVFVGHIPSEALGAQFYTTTRERYRG